MTQVTVKELAKAVNTPVERLLQQMHEAGLAHTSADQKVSDTEKQTLLTFLEKGAGSKADGAKKITLQRKTTTTLRAPGSKTISVEVRKKKTFVKRSPEEIEAEKQKDLAKLKAEQKAQEPEPKASEPVAAPIVEKPAPVAAPASEPAAAEAPEAPIDITLPVVDVVKPAPERKKKKLVVRPNVLKMMIVAIVKRLLHVLLRKLKWFVMMMMSKHLGVDVIVVKAKNVQISMALPAQPVQLYVTCKSAKPLRLLS